MKGSCKRRASCRPTVDFPEPGRPIRLTFKLTAISIFVNLDGPGRQLYRLADLSEIILGVMNTSISCLFEVLLELLNRLPKMGMSPKNGTLV